MTHVTNLLFLLDLLGRPAGHAWESRVPKMLLWVPVFIPYEKALAAHDREDQEGS